MLEALLDPKSFHRRNHLKQAPSCIFYFLFYGFMKLFVSDICFVFLNGFSSLICSFSINVRNECYGMVNLKAYEKCSET